MAKGFRTSVVTANHLVEGHSVFLSPEGWHADIARAMIAFTREEAEELSALAERFVADNLIVGPYLVEVSTGTDGPVPLLRREQIRASGIPTVPYGIAAVPAAPVAAPRRAA